MKRTFRAAFVAACLGAASPALALNICVEGAYPPFSETADDGSIVGFDIDIGQALCAEMGETCELVKVDWDGMIPALLERKCDAIIASMSANAERRQVIDFSGKYYNVPNRFVGPADADFTDAPEDMADKVVGVQRGTIHQAYMEAHYPETELRLYGTHDEMLLDLQAGRIDAVMSDVLAEGVGFLDTPAGEGFDYIGGDHLDPAIHGEGASIGVRKEDTELRDRFTDAIAAIRADGTYDKIVQKYFDFDVYGG
jgi:polar amino acid transport system substrate-binding protein/arginine/ornithine transport system substrate-binding protein